MPMSAKTACRTPRCPNLVVRGFCPDCRAKLGLTDKQNITTSSRWSDWNNATSTARGYGAAWRRIRDQVLRDQNYACQPCKREGFVTLAVQVHHILGRAAGGTDAKDNLEAVCLDCHRKLTARRGGAI